MLREVLVHAGVGDDLADRNGGEIALLVTQPACEILVHGQQGIDLFDDIIEHHRVPFAVHTVEHHIRDGWCRAAA